MIQAGIGATPVQCQTVHYRAAGVAAEKKVLATNLPENSIMASP